MIKSIVLKDIVNSRLLKIYDAGYYLLNANKTVSVVIGPISTYDNTYKSYSQIGKTLANKALDTRPVTITAHVWGETNEILENNKRYLSSFINPLHDFYLIMDNGSYIKFRPETTVRYATNVSDNNELYCIFSINGLAYDPMFYDANETEIIPFRVSKNFKFPLSFNVANPMTFAELINETIVNIINRGDVDVGVTIEISTSAGCVNPIITNVSTQEYIKINKSLAANEKVIINTKVNQKSVKGIVNGVTSNYYKYRDANSSWLQLIPGDNVFSINADSGESSLSFIIKYRNAYYGMENIENAVVDENLDVEALLAAI